MKVWPGGPGSWYLSILEPCMTGLGNHISLVAEECESPCIGPTADNSMNRVLVIRSHGCMICDFPTQGYYDSRIALRESGGIFGIVDHRDDETVPQYAKGANGYWNLLQVISLAKQAGLELLAQSAINANPKTRSSIRMGCIQCRPLCAVLR